MNWHRTAPHICRYLKDHFGPWKRAPMRSLRNYLRWYWQRNLMAVYWHAGKIRALCLIRLHDDPAQFEFPFRHDPNGSICWIDMMIADNRAWMPSVAEKFAKLHAGNTTFKGIFMWKRTDIDRETLPRCYTYERFRRLALSLGR